MSGAPAPRTCEVPGGSRRERIDKHLARLLPEFSRGALQRYLAAGQVRVDGRVAGPRELVGGGARLEVFPLPEAASSAEPDPTVDFEIQYEDEALVVVVKPPGLVVHPARGHETGTLVNGLLARGGFSRDLLEGEGGTPGRPGVVHRLDKDTSGLMVVARTARSREALRAQLEARTLRREYLDLTLGVPAEGRLESLHGRHPTSRLRFTTRVARGKPAILDLRREEVLGTHAALVRCRLSTGRTHQIRVQLAELAGTPLLGDPLYGRTPKEPTLRGIAQRLGRQALHAAVLEFDHPEHGRRLSFESPLPADLKEALAAVRALALPIDDPRPPRGR